jgi:small subunit ribosomal protein S20
MAFEKQIEELHNTAMELADLGFTNRQQGKQYEANVYFAKACKLEEEAAINAIKHGLGQPTVGILLRSAATLASDIGDVGKILSLTKKAVSTDLYKEQENEFLELIAQNSIKLHSLNEIEIDNLIYKASALKSALKRVRANESERLRNRYQHKTTRSMVRKLRDTDDKVIATDLYKKVSSALDKLAKRNIIHKDKAFSLKSKLAKLVNKSA